MPNETNSNQTTNNPPTTGIAARHNARRYAVQAMYVWQMANTPLSEIEIDFMKYHIEKKVDMAYFKLLLHKVPEEKTNLDAVMKPYLGRLQDEIDPIELAVLRIATYELVHCQDIPYRVVINEALELTKQFGSTDGFKFVNGVLDKVARKIRTTETTKTPSQPAK
jgi:N utilization substance protein B